MLRRVCSNVVARRYEGRSGSFGTELVCLYIFELSLAIPFLFISIIIKSFLITNLNILNYISNFDIFLMMCEMSWNIFRLIFFEQFFHNDIVSLHLLLNHRNKGFMIEYCNTLSQQVFQLPTDHQEEDTTIQTNN